MIKNINTTKLNTIINYVGLEILTLGIGSILTYRAFEKDFVEGLTYGTISGLLSIYVGYEGFKAYRKISGLMNHQRIKAHREENQNGR